MDHNILSLDFWQDTVTYEGHSMPTGTIGCAALNIPDAVIEKLDFLCAPINRFMKALTDSAPDPALLSEAKETAIQILNLLHPVSPFDCLDMDFYIPNISKAFTPEGIQKYQAYSMAFLSGTLTLEQTEEYEHGILLGRITPVLAQLAFSLREYKNGMTQFALQLDAAESNRTPDGLAELFGQYFPPDLSLNEENKWMSFTNNTAQYLSTIHPGYDVPMLVKRMHYVSFVGMFRSDLFEGLCVGHAPKKCRICGKWFLTTNARHTKYCGGYAPGDKLHRTCRQIGNLKGREQRELADDHPLKQIYEKRLNTINRYVKRGTLDADLAEVMKKLAKDKMLRALSNVAYAKGAYEKEMDQAALKKEASAKIYKERDKHE